MGTIRVLLADGHELFREGLARLLTATQQLQVVAHVSTGLEAVQRALELQPDLVLMDTDLPECDGITAAQRILRQWPEARIVMLSDHDDEEHLRAALQAGAVGYLTKDVGVERLQGALLLACSGEAVISSRLASRLLRSFCGALEQRQQLRQGGQSRLTARELEVLGMVAQGATNREIAELLVISENTVKVHLRNILDKLHLRNRQQAATFAVQQGLALDLPPVRLYPEDSHRRAT